MLSDLRNFLSLGWSLLSLEGNEIAVSHWKRQCYLEWLIVNFADMNVCVCAWVLAYMQYALTDKSPVNRKDIKIRCKFKNKIWF